MMKKNSAFIVLAVFAGLAMSGCKTTEPPQAAQAPPTTEFDGAWKLLTTSPDPSCGKSTAQEITVRQGAISGRYRGNAGTYVVGGTIDGAGNVAFALDGGLIKGTGAAAGDSASGTFGGACRGNWSMSRA